MDAKAANPVKDAKDAKDAKDVKDANPGIATFTLIGSDKKEVSVSLELVKMYSNTVVTALAENDKLVSLKIDSPTEDLKMMVEYMTYHGKSEPKAPAGSINAKTQLDTSLSNWDLAFVKRVMEKDPFVISMCNSSKALGMFTLMNKLTFVVAYNYFVQHKGSAEAIAKAIEHKH